MLSGGNGGDSESNQIYPWDRLFSTFFIGRYTFKDDFEYFNIRQKCSFFEQ